MTDLFTAEKLVFFAFAIPLLAAAVGVVVARSPMYAAMSLVAAFFCLAGVYVLLSAHLVAFLQVLVYAGAVMVLFLFVIMLLNLDKAPSDLRGPGAWIAATVMGATLLAELGVLGRYSAERLALEFTRSPLLADPGLVFPGAAAGDTATAQLGVVGAVAQPLFAQWLVPFELTSVLLLAAMVGAVVLAKRRV
jgi:NADH-quinone oxidoreductase subunit J